MKSSYGRRFEKLSKILSSEEAAKRARRNGNTFSRKRKMSLKDILISCLAKKGLTTTLELRNYFKEKGGLSMGISKQGYLQQRKRLNPDVFTYLNDEYLTDFYNSEEVKLWNGYLLLAIDGSKAEVPNSEENRQEFGKSTNQHTDQGQVRGLISGMYDILNGFYMDIGIAHISASENEMAKGNIMHLEEIGVKQPILIIFDRGYPSIEFIDFLELKGIHYLFRISSNDYKKERKEMKAADEPVTLKHTSSRLRKIRLKHPEYYGRMRGKVETHTRISKTKLPTGVELTLMTNLSFQYTSKQLQDLYHQRWEIEKKYHTLKNKMKFESITGKASIYVYQDFRAQILVYNMLQDIRNSADLNAKHTAQEKSYRYPVHTNENIAVGLFKEAMISILLEENMSKREKLLSRLQKDMEDHVLPIRNLRSHKRKKNISNKYKNNQKISF